MASASIRLQLPCFARINPWRCWRSTYDAVGSGFCSRGHALTGLLLCGSPWYELKRAILEVPLSRIFGPAPCIGGPYIWKPYRRERIGLICIFMAGVWAMGIAGSFASRLSRDPVICFGNCWLLCRNFLDHRYGTGHAGSKDEALMQTLVFFNKKILNLQKNYQM